MVGYGTQEDPKEMYGAAWQEAVAATAIALVLAGLVYVVFALVIKFVGVQKVRKLFPAIVVGPVVLVIGMILAPKAFQSNIIGAGFEPWKSWTTAIVTALTMVLVNAYAKPKSFLKVIPVLMGFAVGYVYAILISFLPGGSIMSYMVSDAAGNFSHFDFSLAFSADRIIIFQHIAEEFSFYLGFSSPTFGTTLISAILMIVPLAIVTFMEHLGDISANSTICGKDFRRHRDGCLRPARRPRQYDVRRKYRRPRDHQKLRSEEHFPRGGARHHLRHAHSICRFPRVHSRARHRRRVHRALRHDLRLRSAHPGRFQGRLQ